MVDRRIHICYLLFLTACADKNTGIVFPETATLSVAHVYNTDVYMRYPYRIRTAGSSVYVMDLHATEYYIHRLSGETDGKYIASYGMRGQGPMELLDAENIRTDSENRLWTLDANRRKLVVWDSCGQVEINLSPQLIRPLDFALLDDSTFILPDYTGEHRICLVNRNGDIIKKLFSIPDKRRLHTSHTSLAQAWRSFIDYNQKTGILAVVTQLGQVIEIYNLKEERPIASINVGNGAPQFSEKQNYAIPEGIMGYSDVYVSDSTIYALFWGHSFKELYSGKVNHEGGNRLQVFDAEGNPLKEYILDRYITGFCIDKTNDKLIALDVNSDQPIVGYNFLTK
ncbi:MAG: TolB-like 6-bladed beta-propeller domain-containing protein [Tannerella sp.]|jgi:hypothetical protein|nr:TolB-like 6-bladed beta-propeller domain-containing protein [Tannerella sp.]